MTDGARPPDTITLRTAEPEDRPAILEVVRAAFDNDEEVELVQSIWAAPEYLADLEIVAEHEGRILGHVLHSTGYIGTHQLVALAPLAVHPDHQLRGIGSALMKEAIARADREGHPAIVLLGNPAFYGRFGFEPARSLGIHTDMDIPAEPDPFLARPLTHYSPDIRGAFRYAWEA